MKQNCLNFQTLMKFSSYWCSVHCVCHFPLQQLAQVHECMNKLVGNDVLSFPATIVAIIFLLFTLVCAKISNVLLHHQLSL